MKELTKAEEQIMHLLWDLGEGFVNDLIDRMPEPKPAYNTVSTIVRILERKGFVAHRAFGKSHQYYPVIEKKAYTRSYLKSFVGNYFSNSFQELVSFFAKSNNMSIGDLEALMDEVKKDIENKK